MRLAVIGDPIAHSMSPAMYRYIFNRLGLTLHFEKIKVSKRQLPKIFKNGLAYDAVLVTMPLKQKVCEYLTDKSQEVLDCKSCNFMVRKKKQYVGYNSDGIGALNAIEDRFSVAGKRMLVLGAGGCARAICFEAKKRGADLYIYNRNMKKSHDLAEELGATALFALDSSFCIIVQATSVGLTGDMFSYPLNPLMFRSCKIALEVNYGKVVSAFTRLAQEQRVPIIGGEEMYFYMMKEQCNILLQRNIQDFICPEKIMNILMRLNANL